MTKKKRYSYDYSSLNLRASVVRRFRSFARKLNRSQSDTLETMLQFFEWHGVSPFSKFGMSEQNEHAKTRKRVEANIAILRDIEKTQTKPLSIQMDLLFEGQTKQRETPKLVEKKFANSQGHKKKSKDNPVSKVKYQRIKTELKEVKEEFIYVMEKVLPVKNSFGKDYLKMEISLSEFNRILANLKDE